MTSPAIDEISIHVVELKYGPLVSPYEWSGGTDDSFFALIARVASEGFVGWGEAGTLAVDPLVVVRGIIDPWLDAAAACLLGRRVSDYRALGSSVTSSVIPVDADVAVGITPWRSDRTTASVWRPLGVAVELALWDLAARVANVPLRSLIGSGRGAGAEFAAAIGCFDERRAGSIAEQVVALGFRTIKCKGGRGVTQDAIVARRIRDAAGPDVSLRIDPNGAYDLVQARRLSRLIEPLDMQYLEQPCRSDDLMAAASLRQHSAVPVALDEAVLGPRRVLEIHNAEAADVILCELHQLGGLEQLLATAATAEACGLPMAMHAAYSTGIRTAEVVHAVAALPSFTYASDTLYHGLETDLLAEPLQLVGGSIALPDGPGLGIEVDEDRVAASSVATYSRDLLAVGS